jgi:hypothetical protein
MLALMARQNSNFADIFWTADERSACRTLAGVTRRKDAGQNVALRGANYTRREDEECGLKVVVVVV